MTVEVTKVKNGYIVQPVSRGTSMVITSQIVVVEGENPTQLGEVVQAVLRDMTR